MRWGNVITTPPKIKEERLVEWTDPVLLHCYTNIQKVKACGSMH